ncbi:hypothetical protein PR048_033160 [Dryococelus australis]|uniref:Uncharacterized protein n=1 Tax=Dryococelus australis TaxID=614101 RepID=A0ABQ9FZH1_9NEOP|nr:hypothetical protein PR048_033160 [Dryococelus australis]
MPGKFTSAEYVDMVFVYGYCDGNGRGAAAEYPLKCIGRGGPVPWPALSPDLSPIAQGFLHVGIVPDDEAGQLIFTGSPVSPALDYWYVPYSPHFTLVGCQGLDVKGQPNLSIPFLTLLICEPWLSGQTPILLDWTFSARIVFSSLVLPGLNGQSPIHLGWAFSGGIIFSSLVLPWLNGQSPIHLGWAFSGGIIFSSLVLPWLNGQAPIHLGWAFSGGIIFSSLLFTSVCRRMQRVYTGCQAEIDERRSAMLVASVVVLPACVAEAACAARTPFNWGHSGSVARSPSKWGSSVSVAIASKMGTLVTHRLEQPSSGAATTRWLEHPKVRLKSHSVYSTLQEGPQWLRLDHHYKCRSGSLARPSKSGATVALWLEYPKVGLQLQSGYSTQNLGHTCLVARSIKWLDKPKCRSSSVARSPEVPQWLSGQITRVAAVARAHELDSPLVDGRPIMKAVKYRVGSGVVWTNRTMVSSNTDTNRTGVLAVSFREISPPLLMRAIEISMEHVRNEKAKRNGRSLRKPIGQRCCPERFPLAKIRECPGSPWWEEVSALALLASCRDFALNRSKELRLLKRLACSPLTMAKRCVGQWRWRWGFSGFSRFPHPCIPALLHTYFTLTGSQDIAVKSRPNLFTHSSLLKVGYRLFTMGREPWSLAKATELWARVAGILQSGETPRQGNEAVPSRCLLGGGGGLVRDILTVLRRRTGSRSFAISSHLQPLSARQNLAEK